MSLTWREYIEKHGADTCFGGVSHMLREHAYEDIRLDAFKAGMEYAAKKVEDAGGDNHDYHAKSIRDEVETLTSIPKET